jgi:tRNA-splicing ligase RtcB
MGTMPVKEDEVRWTIPLDPRKGMRVPGVVYADDVLMAQILRDASLEQVVNGACLPGILRASLAMPDMHYGYGLPIGGVVATSLAEGVVTPGGVGFDINCGVRLARTRLRAEEVADSSVRRRLAEELFREVPTGVGSTGRLRLSKGESRTVMLKGAAWAVARGFGSQRDLAHTEAGGCLDGADPDSISARAYERGERQQGTLGSGNHFIEIQLVETVFHEAAARAFGLEEGMVTVMIHSGSRGLGHQVCTDFLGVMEKALRRYGISVPDRQLACAPIGSPEGEAYLGAMRAAANYAWANRQCLMHWTGEAIEKALGLSPAQLGLALVYDVAHNIVKIEEHEVDGRRVAAAVHRKGATRAFGPGHPELPGDYRTVGQPVIIPGDMGRCSYVLAGTAGAMRETFGSCCHGAGRALSRTAAVKKARGRSIGRELEERGIFVRADGRDTLGEEMPEAYKDVSRVVDVVERAGLAVKVARMRPVAVIKG